jgi:hypothetical protein
VIFNQRTEGVGRSLKQEGTRRGILGGTWGQKGGMFGKSTRPVNNVPSDTPGLLQKVRGTGRSGTKGGVLQRGPLGRNEANLVARHARPPSERLLSQRNKASVHSSANTGVEGCSELFGGGDGVTWSVRGGGQDGFQQCACLFFTRSGYLPYAFYVSVE